MMSPLPSAPAVNPAVTGPNGEEVIMLDVVGFGRGAALAVTFEHIASDWRQGVWLGTDGSLEIGETRSSQVVLWHDAAPTTVHARLLEGDGLLRVYNVWDSRRGVKDFESQSATSGMIIERFDHGARRYHCNDIGYGQSFDTLVFTIQAM